MKLLITGHVDKQRKTIFKRFLFDIIMITFTFVLLLLLNSKVNLERKRN